MVPRSFAQKDPGRQAPPVIWLGVLLLSLAGCAASPARHAGTAGEIQSELDRALAAKPRAGEPQAVQDALLPPLRITVPKAAQKPVEPRFDLVVNDAPANQVFMGIVSGTRYSMLVHPDVTGAVSVNLKDVTVFEALDALHELYGYDYRVDGNRIFILPRTMQTRIFQVNYLTGQRRGTSDIRVVSGSVSDTATAASTAGATTTPTTTSTALDSSKITTTSGSDFWHELTASLTAIIGDKDGRQVVVSPQSGVVVVRAMPDELNNVAAYLRATPGADLQGPSGLTGASGAAASLFSLAFQTSSFAALLSFLETQGTVHVLSSPRIATLNNQQAVLKVGSDEFFVTSVSSSTTSTAAAPTASTNVTVQPFFSGIALDVTPQIDASGDIILHIHPSVSQVTTDTKQVTLGNLSGQSNTISLPLAKSTVSETDSMVRAHDAQIVAIGGLMSTSTSKDRSQLPGLGDVPVLGTLFGQTNQVTQKSELVILLKATVVRGAGDWTADIAASRRRIRALERVRDPSAGDAESR